MLQFRIGLMIALLCAFTSASFAQDAATPVHPSHRTHIKKAPRADTSSVENWDIALPGSSSKADIGQDQSEGRKKFFEQSTTMDNGGPAGAAGGSDAAKPSTGFTPSMGLNF